MRTPTLILIASLVCIASLPSDAQAGIFKRSAQPSAKQVAKEEFKQMLHEHPDLQKQYRKELWKAIPARLFINGLPMVPGLAAGPTFGKIIGGQLGHGIVGLVVGAAAAVVPYTAVSISGGKTEARQ